MAIRERGTGVKTTVTNCDRCGNEIDVLDRMAAFVEIRPRSADTAIGKGIRPSADLCADCVPVLAKMLGLGER
jgi:hypothetical protein